MTFGRARLQNEVQGITMSQVNREHAEKVESGAWQWKHASAAARRVDGQRSVPAALTISKPLEDIRINVEDFMPKGRADPALAPSNMGHEITKVLKGREKCCQYRHQEDGNQYICNNSWISKEMTTCLYHVKFCMQCDPAAKKRSISLPNKYGLCDKHYVSKYHQLPPELRAGVPGLMVQSGYRMSEVARVTNGLYEKVALDPRTTVGIESKNNGKKEGRKRNTQRNRNKKRNRNRKSSPNSKKEEEQKVGRIGKEKGRPNCSWNKMNDKGWRYQCTNVCATQKKTGAILPVCAWHITHCRIDNPWIPICNKIRIPNHLGESINRSSDDLHCVNTWFFSFRKQISTKKYLCFLKY